LHAQVAEHVAIARGPDGRIETDIRAVRIAVEPGEDLDGTTGDGLEVAAHDDVGVHRARTSRSNGREPGRRPRAPRASAEAFMLSAMHALVIGVPRILRPVAMSLAATPAVAVSALARDGHGERLAGGWA